MNYRIYINYSLLFANIWIYNTITNTIQIHNFYNVFSLFIAPQNLRFESIGLICFFIYKIILDKLVFPSYNALTAEEKSHWDLGLFSLFSTAFRIYFLTTSLTIVRFGLRGFSITREHLFPWFCLHAITKRYYLTLKKLKTLGWGGRGRKFKPCHFDHIE